MKKFHRMEIRVLDLKKKSYTGCIFFDLLRTLNPKGCGWGANMTGWS